MFMPGDEVECISDICSPYFTKGMIYKVKEYTTNGRLVVEQDNFGQETVWGSVYFKLLTMQGIAEGFAAIYNKQFKLLNEMLYKKECTCESLELFRKGCKCGAVQPKKWGLAAQGK